MPIEIETTQSPTSKSPYAERHAYRFHAPHLHLQSVFGDDWFALQAEAFARFFWHADLSHRSGRRQGCPPLFFSRPFRGYFGGFGRTPGMGSNVFPRSRHTRISEGNIPRPSVNKSVAAQGARYHPCPSGPIWSPLTMRPRRSTARRKPPSSNA